MDTAAKNVKVGVTTDELDRIVHEVMTSRNLYRINYLAHFSKKYSLVSSYVFFICPLFQACLERNCYPSPLNYHGFPKSCCTLVLILIVIKLCSSYVTSFKFNTHILYIEYSSSDLTAAIFVSQSFSSRRL